MKIITNTKRQGKLCYVQVKDLLFLARYTDNRRLMQDYLNCINNGKTDEEFIKVSGDGYIKAFELCDYIIDFSEYCSRNIGTEYLSRLITTKAYVAPKDAKEKDGVEHQIDGIRDAIAYKRGDTDYRVPLVSDGRLEATSGDGKFIFDSTVVNDCFVLSTADGSELYESNYQEFFDECVNKVFTVFYPDIKEDERRFGYYEKGKVLVLSIHRSKPEKKKGVVGRILAKIKKED
jgi:hypothetical protein